MSHIPKVSVGMPVYNGAAFLADTIESILNQSFSDFELVISDNGSTDETEKICRDYAKRDSRIRSFRFPKNLGASENYTAVFRYSRAEYFKWSSGNDWCGPTFLSSCVAVLDERPDVVLVYPGTRLFTTSIDDFEEYEEGLDLQQDRPSERFRAYLCSRGLNNVMNGVIRSSALRRTPVILPFISSDVCLIGELTLHGKFFEVPEPLFYRRMSAEASTMVRGVEGIRRHYDPDMTSPMLMQEWRHVAYYARAALQAPISVTEKASAFGLVLRKMNWSRRSLGANLVQAAAFFGRQALSIFRRRTERG